MLFKTWIPKYLIKFEELTKQAMYLSMRLVNVNVDWMQVFVTINNIGIMRNANVNVNN